MSHKYYYEVVCNNTNLQTGIFNANSDEEALEICGSDIEKYDYMLIQNVDDNPYTVFDSETLKK